MLGHEMSDKKSLIEKWQKKIETIQDAIEYNFLTINSWEEEFLDSIEKRLSDGKELSWKQSKILNSIYGRIE